MFGVGSFFIPLAAQACKHLFGSPVAVFWLVSGFSVLAALPFLFVASPTRPVVAGAQVLQHAPAWSERPPPHTHIFLHYHRYYRRMQRSCLCMQHAARARAWDGM